MNVLTATVFVVWTISIIVLNSTRLINAHNCTTVKHDNGIFENCSYRNLIINVPQDLDPSVTEIDLSGNRMRNLGTEHGFDRYTLLTTLIMRNMTRMSPFSKSPNLFHNMYSLEVIDFSFTYAEESQLDFSWPPNIRIIYCTNNLIKNFNTDYLKKLEKLFASDNPLMEDFPKFHDLARISLIDLKNNSLIQDLSTDIISTLCFLDHLNVTVNLTLLPLCNCLHLRSWLIRYGVRMDTEMDCGRSPGSSRNCNRQPTELQLSNRRNCLARGLSTAKTTNWYYVLPLIMIIAVSLLIPSYLYARKIRTAHHKLHHPHPHPTLSSTETPSATLSSAELPDEEEDDVEDLESNKTKVTGVPAK